MLDAGKRWLLIGIILAAVMLIVSGALEYLSTLKLTERNFVDSQRYAASQTIAQMDFALGLGKPMEHFYGAGDALERMEKRSGHIDAAWILDQDGNFLYAMPADTNTSRFPVKDGEDYAKIADGYYTELSFSDGSTLCMRIRDGDLATLLSGHVRMIVWLGLGLFAAACALLFALRRFGKRSVIIVLLSVQLLYGSAFMFMFPADMRSSLSATMDVVGRVIQDDITKLTDAGIRIDDLDGLPKYLADTADDFPELSAIRVGSVPENDEQYIHLGAFESSAKTYEIYAAVDAGTIRKAMLDRAIQTIVIMAIMLFLMLEISMYAGGSIQTAQTAASTRVPQMRETAARFFFFLLYAAVSMGAAFVIIVASKLCAASGISSDLIMSLPLTVEMAAGLIAVSLSAFLVSKLHYNGTLILSVAVCTVGALLTGLAGDIVLFTAGRAFSGFGFALATICGRLIISSFDDAETRTRLLADLIAGSLVGLCCGSVVGGLVADAFSFQAVYFASAVVTVGCLLFLPAARFSRIFPRRDARHIPAWKSMRNLLASGNAVAYLLLVALPVYAIAMFLSYNAPLYGYDLGMTPTMISAMRMANSLLAAYLANFTTRLTQRRLGAGRGVLLYAFMSAGALIAFSLFPTLPMLLAAVILLGIADSFGLTMLLEYFIVLSGEKTERNEERMIVMTFTNKAGNMLAPPLITIGNGMLVALVTTAGATIYGLRFILRKKRRA